MSKELSEMVSRFEAVAARLENLPSLTSTVILSKSKSSSSVESQMIIDFDQIIKTQLNQFEMINEKIGGDVLKQILLVKKVFNTQMNFLRETLTHSKPSDKDLQIMLQATSAIISEIVEFRESNRRSEYFNHLSAISEGIPALGWVTVSPAPCPYIKEMQDASQFYTNRVIKDFKEKDAIHSEWTKAWLALLVELQAFVKKHFTTGITWNIQGSASAALPVCAIPKPPHPPPSKPALSSGDDDTVKHAALFAQLNKGAGITSGLKKVTDDMKTHKSPELRAGSIVPASKEKSVSHNHTQHVEALAKHSAMNLEGNKWIVEHFKDKKDIVISDTAIKQTLYIFKCVGSVITVKGKINSIVLDNCKKTALVFDGLISSLDIVNCQSVQVQTLGVLPIVNIDKTDGAQIVLSNESFGVEIISAKSSEMNIVIVNDTGDVKEMALPEQFKTKIVNGKLMTSCTEDF